MMEERWRLPDSIHRIEREGRVLLFNPEVPAWLVTNANGALLLSLCDGNNTVGDIITACAQVDGNLREDDVLRFFRMARDSGIFDASKQKPVRCQRQTLSQVQLSISPSCNLSCRYCYATDRREGKHARLTLDDYKQLTDDILSLAPHVSFSLTGGEPLVNNDCLAIARHIRERGADVDLLTNATLINEHNVEDIARLFSRVSISIDGSTPQLHDFFRGKNSYERTEKALLLLESHGADCFLSMTVNSRNIHDVEAMAQKYGRRLTFQPLFPAGNATKGEDISITGRQYYEALKRAHGVNPLGYCEATLDASLHDRRHKCAVGGAELSISPTGDVYPCQLLHYPQFLIGNVHDQPISSLIASSPVIDNCAAMTVDNIEGCRSCFLRYVCGGACRARAFHECGDIMTCGTFCEYEREAFTDGIFSIYSENAIEASVNKISLL